MTYSIKKIIRYVNLRFGISCSMKWENHFTKVLRYVRAEVIIKNPEEHSVLLKLTRLRTLVFSGVCWWKISLDSCN